MSRYVALLRGINVGGKNVIRMVDLAACFEAQRLADVTTYIQSGNVVFTSAEPAAALTRRLEAALAARFGYQASVVLRTRQQLAATVTRAPAGFGASPARYRYDVLFLKAPLTAATAMKSVLIEEGVDEAHGGSGVIYYSRLIARATQSRLTRLASMPIYQRLTIRNWNTTTKLLEMMER